MEADSSYAWLWSGLISTGLFAAVWKAGHSFISPSLIPDHYRRFSEKDKLDWNSRYGSTLHALLIVMYAANVLFLTDAFEDSFMAKLDWETGCFRDEANLARVRQHNASQ
ncbi:hypothetical protein WJX84_002135 [Apatococcus fuscideae]|uniref:Uncharacterized protein n=1 Tax=Apatococcus fuscideae TaxID=2026836 RepID=A0AAW1RJ76_9CHLO